MSAPKRSPGQGAVGAGRWVVGVLATALMLGFVAAPARAWGPRTDLALVATAAHIISEDGRVPLAKLEKDIIRGVAASSREMAAMYPGYEGNPVGVIEAEMYLLQAVRGERIDPYFAHRLGVLGKLVAQITAPMAFQKPTYRDLYYADVDQHIDRVPLGSLRRTVVKPKDYLASVMHTAGLRDEFYEKDYQDGEGFQGIAKASLADDASRSVAAVVDVWHTVLTVRVLQANRSEGGIRDYVVGGIEYYVRHGQEGLVNATYDHLMSLTRETPALHKRLGDVFYNGQMYDRAMAEYQATLALAPGDKEVVEKIANYYEHQGDQAMDKGEFESALAAYAKALQADPLHPAAESKRLRADKLIAEREERIETAQLALQVAEDLWRRADQAVLEGQFAEAIVLLQDAEAQYNEVPFEFPLMFKKADSALKQLSYRMGGLKQRLVEDAQNLSGSGFMSSADGRVAASSSGLEERALRVLLDQQLEAQLNALREDLRGPLEIR